METQDDKKINIISINKELIVIDKKEQTQFTVEMNESITNEEISIIINMLLNIQLSFLDNDMDILVKDTLINLNNLFLQNGYKNGVMSYLKDKNIELNDSNLN